MPIASSAQYISQLNALWPLGSDQRGTAAPQLRLLTYVLQTQFPNFGAGPVTVTNTDLNTVGVTQTLGDSSTKVASTAFVQNAIANVNSTSGIPTASIVTGTTQAAVAGAHYILTNAAATTVTLPASATLGGNLWITVANGRVDNVVARNGLNIMKLAENLTLDDPYARILLRYVDATNGWRIIN
jgi:hypothetical protein